MGKTLILKNIGTGPNSTPRSLPTLPRTQLIEAIDAALSKVAVYRGEDARALLAEPMYQLARTTDKIDASAWRCEGSCGCPLTAAGFAADRPVNFDSDSFGFESPHTVFYGEFDDQMRRRTGYEGAKTITITD